MQKRIQILVVDDNPEICNDIINFLNKFDDINICATANDGLMAIDKIFEFKPDVLILDIIMPLADGIYVLKKIKADYKKPIQIIMISNNGNDVVIRRTLSLGADHFMIKPIIMQSLLDCIRFLHQNSCVKFTNFELRNDDLISIIKTKIVEIGIPTNHLGYYYLIEALTVIVSSSSHILISEVYEEVAQRQNTNFKCVESAIRNAATHAFKNCNENYRKIFFKNNSITKPTNSRFVSLLAEEIKLDLY